MTIGMDRETFESERWDDYYDECVVKGLIRYKKGKISDKIAKCDRCGYIKAKIVIQDYDEVLPNGLIWQKKCIIKNYWILLSKM
jgi:hypothetical protein